MNKQEPPAAQQPPKSKKISQTDIPSLTLEQALRVPLTIAENYAKSSTRPIDVAASLNMSPTSGPFRQLCGAAIGYGLTDGGPNASTISLTALGRRIVSPLEEGDDFTGRREAVLVPTVERTFLQKYDGSPLPQPQIAYNVLEAMDVPSDRSKRVFELIVHNADQVGYLKNIKEKKYVDLGGDHAAPATATSTTTETEPTETPDPIESSVHQGETPVTPPTRPNAIFLGHGKNRKPLEQLIKILDEYGIPHKEAVAEANAGRPIPTKVADTLRECGAAILIFTADEKFLDADGNEVWRPSENVIHELGAASMLYDNRIIIFRENGVLLASNFDSIGYIGFDTDKLSDKGMELFRELIKFKILNFSVGG
ncbi:MAG TPA: TIR domain-containing protein [Candidatus Saccharimonadales bacterium]|nr:TIR domain-containing protein [Candidatus Saccharimonadales bacterium]